MEVALALMLLFLMLMFFFELFDDGPAVRP